MILDPDFNFKSHISNVTKTPFYHLRNIAKVQPFLSQADTERLMHAFITSRLDYCNALSYIFFYYRFTYIFSYFHFTIVLKLYSCIFNCSVKLVVLQLCPEGAIKIKFVLYFIV